MTAKSVLLLSRARAFTCFHPHPPC